MFKRFLCVAVWCLGFVGSSHAALSTSTTWDTLYPGIAGVQFNQDGGNGVTIGLGAHGYKNGILLPNDGVSTFYAQPGLYPEANPADGRANWSFDFFVDLTGYVTSGVYVELLMDSDPSAAQNMMGGMQPVPGALFGDSWNLEMDLLEAFMGVPFDPNANGIYDFRLSLFETDNPDVAMLTTSIRVIVGEQEVPEPGMLALMALALMALALMQQRRRQWPAASGSVNQR